LQRAIDEMQFSQTNGAFDLIIVNDCIEKAYNGIKNFILQVFSKSIFSIPVIESLCLFLRISKLSKYLVECNLVLKQNSIHYLMSFIKVVGIKQAVNVLKTLILEIFKRTIIGSIFLVYFNQISIYYLFVCF
jgi:hypothetical protein